jgi:hypothetical protein
MSQVILKNIVGTKFYQPEQPAPDEKFLFLLVSNSVGGKKLDSTIALDETWQEDGPGAFTGYYLFLNKMPAAGSFAEFETLMKEKLPAVQPSHSSFGWIKISRSSPSKVDSAQCLSVGIEKQSKPFLADDFLPDASVATIIS